MINPKHPQWQSQVQIAKEILYRTKREGLSEKETINLLSARCQDVPNRNIPQLYNEARG